MLVPQVERIHLSWRMTSRGQTGTSGQHARFLSLHAAGHASGESARDTEVYSTSASCPTGTSSDAITGPVTSSSHLPIAS